MARTVVFDFDGVIHSYTSGWKGETNIPDPPVPGIQEALKEIHDAGYEVVVVSTRCKTVLGRMAIENWLDMYGMTQEVDKVCKEKPPAIAYIDDRAICFDGHPKTLLKKIQNFQPWYKMPTLTPPNEWVSVEERLPEKHCSTAITDLLARAEAAEAANSQLNVTVTTLMESNRKLAEELKVYMETDLAKAHDALSADWAKQKQRAKAAEARAEKAERERDAAISDLTYIARTYPVDLCDDLVCQYCKHYQNVNTGCPGWTENDCFEWRGIKEG